LFSLKLSGNFHWRLILFGAPPLKSFAEQVRKITVQKDQKKQKSATFKLKKLGRPTCPGHQSIKTLTSIAFFHLILNSTASMATSETKRHKKAINISLTIVRGL
jgi:hypothetical protein